MNGKIKIEYPESLANVLKLSDEDFAKEMKISSLVKLYEIGRVSSGVAANVLGISRIEFYELLAKYKVSMLGDYSVEDLKNDIANA